MGIFGAFRKLFFRASPEDPQTSLSDPDVWFEEWAGVGDGNLPAVNPNTALGVPAIAAAVRRRSQTIASLSVGVYRRTEEGMARVRNHPLDSIISESPHPLYSSFQLWQAAVTNLDVTGNAFIEIKRDARGRPAGLELIPTQLFIDIRKEITSGEYFYFFRSDDEKRKIKQLPVEDVIHLKGLNYDGVHGLNPTKVQRDAIAAGLANDTYSATFYANGGHIQYALEAPQEFSKKAKAAFRREWRRLFAGIKKAFRDIPIIDRGGKLHQLKLDAKQAALVEAKKAFVQDAARMFDVPGHMIGAGDNYTFASVEVMVTDFVMYSIRNTVKQIESELNRKAFTESEKGELFVRFNIDSLLRGDTETRTKKIETELKWGVITVNEARELSGYNKVPGLDVFLSPLNMEKSEA